MRDTPRILIVDDTPINLELIESILATGGFSTTTAPDGPTAVAMCRTEPPSLILLDIITCAHTDGLIETTAGRGRGLGLKQLAHACKQHLTAPLAQDSTSIARVLWPNAQDDLLLLAVDSCR